MKKIRILYDISGMSSYNSKNSNRTGIFFCIYNVLIELAKREDVELTLYSEQMDRDLISVIVNDKNVNKGNICFYGYNSAIIKRNNYNKKIEHVSKIIDKSSGIKKIIYRIIRKYNHIKNISLLNKKNDISKISISSKRYDAYMSPYNPQSQEIYNTEIKKFTIIYDTIAINFPYYFTELNYDNWYKDLIKQLNKNDYYFTISINTKKDLIEKGFVDPSKVYNTYIGSSSFDRKLKKLDDIKEKYKIPSNKKYIFSLCSLEPRKNLLFAIDSFLEFVEKNKIEDFIYVLGGAAWEGFLEKIKTKITKYNKFKDKIFFIGYVDDEDLSTLYRNAEMFIYPTLYEGFGMPVLEAMELGVPVISSNNSSIPEVVGDAGILINPYNKHELISAIERLYDNKILREDLIKKGYVQSKKFSWKSSVDIMVNTIKTECCE